MSIPLQELPTAMSIPGEELHKGIRRQALSGLLRDAAKGPWQY
jgi:hypothetical protein